MLRRAACLLALSTTLSSALAVALGTPAAASSPRESPEPTAVSQAADGSYKRLTRIIRVPVEGAQLSFWTKRDTEPGWDYFFVEARTAGGTDWTTLPDSNGHTSPDTGQSCPYWHQIHPFLAHYQRGTGEQSCSPEGHTGEWWAASGTSDDYERWSVDLSRYAGRDAEVSISYASDDVVQGEGVEVSGIVISTGADPTDRDGVHAWRVGGPPEGSAPNANDWVIRQRLA
jgi:hypothetical protein